MAPLPTFEYAVIGSSPLAELLAGLIASSHGKSVCLISERVSPIRITRGIDLSVAAVTRPQTWEMLVAGRLETLKLLGRVGGKSAITRLDPVFVAERATSMAALSHVRHMAAAFGHEVQRLPPHQILTGAAAYRMRDAVMLDRAALQGPLAAWLAAAGVKRLAAPEIDHVLHRDGSLRVQHDKFRFDVERTVLADDAAILDNAGEENYGRTLAVQPMTAILTEPARPLPAPVMVYADRGVTLVQRAGRNITALVAGGVETAAEQLGDCLAGQTPLRRAGQAVFSTLVSRDGAPVVGRLKGSKAFILAGLGFAGAFLAPMLARGIAGEPGERERAWLDAHDPSRNRFRGSVADFGPPEETETAA